MARVSGVFLKGNVGRSLRSPVCLTAQSEVGDPVGRIICCNPRICDLTTEQQRDERVGKPVRGVDSLGGWGFTGDGQRTGARPRRGQGCKIQVHGLLTIKQTHKQKRENQTFKYEYLLSC